MKVRNKRLIEKKERCKLNKRKKWERDMKEKQKEKKEVVIE